MKRLLPICLAAAALSPTANAQRDHDPYPAEHCEHEWLNCPEPTGRPVIDWLRRDFCMIRSELDRGFFEVRHELRRAFVGRPYRGEPVDYYTESDRRYVEPERFERYEDPSYRADESYGRFSKETLERTRRRAAERERYSPPNAEIEVQRRRARELAERTAPQVRRRPAQLETDPAPIPPVPRREAPAAPQPPREIESAPEPTPQPPLDKNPVDPITLPDREKPDPAEGGYTEAEKRNFPLATKTDRPGFVRSPYPPFELLDVTGIAPGDLAMEPEGERVFRVPK